MSEHRPVVRVRDVMKRHLDIVDGLTTVAEALRMMRHVETKTLLVSKRHENDEYGIVLVSDIAKKVLAVDRPPERVHIYEIMTKPVLTMPPDMDIRYVARFFNQFGLSRAPVLEDGEVIGIISHTDMVLKGLVRDL